MIEEVFENLVGQFSDPFTFYRELIQNSLDAGSNRVDVRIDTQDDDLTSTCAVIEVSDDGEGMNRQIIDGQLTKLFSSTKENDLTKIGKFGIGFVSVFAIGPELVLLDTGRAGEYWRVLFDGSTRFQCLPLEAPIEGTRVRLYKRIAKDELAAFRRRSHDTIRKWCRYSDSPIYFDGAAINESLAVDAICTITHDRPGTELVCGLSAESPPSFGMYNRGLTLREGHERFVTGVAFRLKSRYLEHTLTRDNVIHDRQYDKALAIVAEVARNQLTERFFELAHSLQGAALDALMHEAAAFLGNWKAGMPSPAAKRPLFPSLNRGRVSIADLRWSAFREGAVYLDEGAGAVSDALGRQGVPVIAGRVDGGMAAALQAVTGYLPRRASQSVAAPPLLDPPPEVRQLEQPLLEILSQGRRGVKSVRVARFDYDGSCVDRLACLVAAAEDDPVRLYQRALWRRLKVGPSVLLLNPAHPLVRRALQTAARAPLLSAFVLAKAALLQDGLAGDLEARLVGRVVRRAQAR